jgi:hypothetical protein
MSVWCCSLEQLHQIARRVRDQNLATPGPGRRLTAEGHLGGLEPVDLGVEVVHN